MNQTCQQMIAAGPSNTLAAFAQVVVNNLGGLPCMDNSYADFIAQASGPNMPGLWEAENIYR